MSGKLLRSTSIIAVMTLVSRISGLLRDIMFANMLGDKSVADIFFIAFRIPNFFRRITAEGAFAAGFVPVFTDFRQNSRQQDTDRFIQLVLGWFGLILAVISVSGVLCAPWLVKMLAWGFQYQEPGKFAQTVAATRLTFPYLFFISLVAMSAGILNSCGRFAAPAVTPVLLNLSLITAALWLTPVFTNEPAALAVGVLIAGLVQLIFQIPFLRREKITLRPRLRPGPGGEAAKKGVKQVFSLMLPAIFGVSVAQLNVLVGTLLASLMAEGSVAWLYYSERLMEFPVGVFGIALGTVILPNLSRKHAAKSPLAFSRTLDWAARWVTMVCVPATAALTILAWPLISTIYFHGDFTENGVHMSTASLIAYSAGLLPIVMVKVLAPGYYARKNTRIPVRIGVVAMIVNIVVSLLLFRSMQHVGLAMATSIAAMVNALLLYSGLRREGVFVAESGWILFFLKVLCATTVMSIMLLWAAGDPANWLAFSVSERILKLLLWVPAGGLVYFLVLYICGLRVHAMLLDRKSE